MLQMLLVGNHNAIPFYFVLVSFFINVRADSTYGKRGLCSATQYHVLYASAFHFNGILNGPFTIASVYCVLRALRIPEYCAVNEVFLQNKTKPDL